MSSTLDRLQQQDGLLRISAARLGRAVTNFLNAGSPEQLPLDAFHADELRGAALRTLALLDQADVERTMAVEADQCSRADRAVRALASLDLPGLPTEARAALAEAVAAVHADLRACGDEDVTRALLDSTPASADLAALIFALDPNQLGPDAQVSFCQAAQRLESAAHARLSVGMVAFAGANPRHTQFWVDGDEHVLTDVRSSELASALSWSGNRARTAVEAARAMHDGLEAAAEAAAAGALQPAAVTAIAEGAQLLTASFDDAIAEARAALRLDVDSSGDIADRIWELTSVRDELVQQYDAAVSAFAPNHTLAETKRKVRDTLAKLDPDGFAARRAKAREVQSGVEFRALPDAMAMLTAVMPSEHASACFHAINAAAHDQDATDPTLPVGVRRSDALLAFCARTLPDSAVQHAAGEHAVARDAAAESDVATTGASTTARAVPLRGTSAHVDLVMTLDAFLGLTETPADCVGAGPIPAAAAREFLANASLVTFRRVLVDGATGHALDVGVQRYALTERERDYIFLRDRTCRRPGCNMPAHRCEADHAIPFDEGGGTTTANLGALCVRHHQEKTHGGWAIEGSEPDGSCTFVSPLGRRYEHAPAPVLPWATPDPRPAQA